MTVGAGTRVQNRSELTDHGNTALRHLAIDLAEVALGALSPQAGLERWVALVDDDLVVGRRHYDLGELDRVVVLGAGKASAELALGIERLLGDRLSGGIVAIPRGQDAASERVRFLHADHPLPSAASAKAATALVDAARPLSEHDLAICLFTGGSSALASLPPQGVTVDDKHELHRQLLTSGMSIVEVNTVRKHVSRIKGGRLAALVHPALIVNLTVSDVVGDPFDCITDPSVQDTSTPADAIEVLEEYRLIDEIPRPIRAHLSRPAARSPDLGGMDIESVIVTRGRDGIEAVATEAVARGFAAISLGDRLEGEAATLGALLAALARNSRLDGTPFRRRSVVVACGGESTVALGNGAAPRFGAGGPNQESAVAAALALSEVEGVVALFCDTDGSDGGGPIAGAIVDASSAPRAHRHNVRLRRALINHHSTAALERIGDALITGPTHTNANDLVVLVID
jgi:glycerate 2-kinase